MPPRRPPFNASELDPRSLDYLGQLKNIVDAAVTPKDSEGVGNGTFEIREGSSLVRQDNEYRVSLSTDDEYMGEDGGEEAGNIGSFLEFDGPTLAVADAGVSISDGRGGGRERPMTLQQLPGFLGSLVTSLQTELS